MIIVFGKVTMWTMKSSREISRVNVELVSSVSETVSVSIMRCLCDELCVRWYKYNMRMQHSSHQLLMTEMESVSETLDANSILAMHTAAVKA
jgi:hypothetical protein